MAKDQPSRDADASASVVRLDVWLDVACLFRTRSDAQRACRVGKVDVNEQRAKPHRTVQEGDRLAIRRPEGRTQRVVVRGVAGQHLPKSTARTLYDDVTPPPTADELEFRRLVGDASGPRGRRAGPTRAHPDKRARREGRRLKEG